MQQDTWSRQLVTSADLWSLLPEKAEFHSQIRHFHLMSRKTIKMPCGITGSLCVNYLWPGGAIWWYRCGSEMPQVMAWWLTASSHYLGQCWIITNGVLWRANSHGISRHYIDVALPEYSGPCFNIKTIFPMYGDPRVKDKTVARPSYLYYGDPLILHGKTTSLYWGGPLVSERR